MAHNTGTAQCSYCGAEYRLVSDFKRDMQRLCKAWLSRHERACACRTPDQRRSWAQKYVGKDFAESSLTVDLEHPGFKDIQPSHAGNGALQLP
ncbi:hypothetical protein DZA28_28440 [Pseudomonas alloputida]|uniref:Uncharacterized protein n=5 Tax=Pseudomonas TaxID=286 RepID=A0A3G1DGE5_PSEAI|nr:hypothetical protein [Pseudomonas aeruginosa]AGN82356.1 hypothetical protein L483_15540 [Pseudomonas putida H8234]AXQ51026.1 hypothetical protein DZC31_30405 [Stenotrophomonas rhizophila]ENY74089.1 hypothetical protein C206_28921 [Pseudomonas putida TRO1]KIC81605.1 hypothetical protein RR51_15920 [Pseudomonas sp. C5pp]KYC16469.1 hypothetical protein WM94_23775 [Pseudomonas sp. ABFPK]OAH47824.1 hypothetical protein AYJ70_27705 [Pseudomonas monteilii]PKF23119.1 hypothetical protein CW309_29